MSKAKISSDRILFVVSAPSGAGKTTVVRKFLRLDRSLERVITHTNRPPRPGERHGKDYFFVSSRAFDQGIRRKQFVEWAEAYGWKYGSSWRELRRILGRRKDPVFVIEENGARAVRAQFRNAVCILLVPPSPAELKRRIKGRSGMPAREMALRIRAARREIRAMRWYPYLIVNERLAEAVSALAAIVAAERLRMSRRRGRAAAFLK